ncbi:oxysterol-binding protein-related protein 9 isoform X2 [Colias croceus]|uniref:oxysterol-binding protein-related protein 9 isoform X2 n=1 Tax=Colias crocea TaxID=72248 RepID=UPI001E279E64|nr:oxysterol-binding protein-related protein 9 isoform X2 [Colias croceus]
MMEGSLSKWTNVMKGWQYRWFVLDENAGLLSYYTSKEKMTRGVRRGCVRLRAAVIGIDDEDDSTFTITVDHKTFHFQARDGSERERWVRALEDTIARHGRRERWSRCVPAPAHRHGDLERRISEADAYLQIMIELVNKLNIRVSDLTEPHEKSRAQVILDHANAMLDNIKHSIVLLQIAKNTVNPVNGVYQGPTNPSQAHIKEDLSPRVELGSECRELPPLPMTPLDHIDAPRQAMSLLVPDTSYSSSEGEDDFYDADEEPASQTDPGPSASRTCGAEGAAEQDASPVDLPRTRDGEIDYDALYEDDSDSDLGSMENHGSVVTHLLSQVKIGMDLTKVVLPTFILERRSLLEMYADSFAHPDQFVKIVDQPTPRERMVQVVRWYLSSYHAGRKSQVAKKPYNPILGEVFRCHWDLDGVEPPSNGDKQEVGDGPVPWCSPDQLSFVAEQVSHHPPISAFYAEHVNKRIQFEAWVWTKSKFLGLSIGVLNIGKGTVTLLDLGEEYTHTFPNGYGRSILTVPWIELGGSVVIECVQTGHKANVEFLTKPFYGGKKHRVTCEVFAGDKKPYYTAQGEWNTRMDGRWTESGRTEVVFDVSTMKPRRKRVAPVSRQAAHESRRVWRHVTAALRAADTDGATAAKRRLEQAQRDAAKRRADGEQQWLTQVGARGAADTDGATAAKRRLEQAQRDAAKRRADGEQQWLTQVGARGAADTDGATAAKRRLEQAQRDAAKRRADGEQQWLTQLFSPKTEEGWEYNTPLKKRIEANKPSPERQPENAETR